MPCARFRPWSPPRKTMRSSTIGFALWRPSTPVGRDKYPLAFFVHENELQYVDQVELDEFVPMESADGCPKPEDAGGDGEPAPTWPACPRRRPPTTKTASVS